MYDRMLPHLLNAPIEYSTASNQMKIFLLQIELLKAAQQNKDDEEQNERRQCAVASSYADT